MLRRMIMQLHFGKRKQQLIKKNKREKSFHLERLDCVNFCRESVPLKQCLVSLRGVGFALSFLRCLGSIRDVIERGRGFALSGLL